METTQQNNDEMEIDLLELFHVLWSKALVILLSTAAMGLAAMLVTQVFLTPQYQSTTKMYILTQQNNETVTSSDLQLNITRYFFSHLFAPPKICGHGGNLSSL